MEIDSKPFVGNGFQIWEVALNGQQATIWTASGLVNGDRALVPRPMVPGMVALVSVVSVTNPAPVPVQISGTEQSQVAAGRATLIPGPLFPGQTAPMKVGTPIMLHGPSGAVVKFQALIQYPEGVRP